MKTSQFCLANSTFLLGHFSLHCLAGSYAPLHILLLLSDSYEKRNFTINEDLDTLLHLACSGELRSASACCSVCNAAMTNIKTLKLFKNLGFLCRSKKYLAPCVVVGLGT